MLLQSEQTEKALSVLETWLPAAQNVHVPEHAAIVRSLDDVVHALLKKSDASQARSSVEYILKVLSRHSLRIVDDVTLLCCVSRATVDIPIEISLKFYESEISGGPHVLFTIIPAICVEFSSEISANEE